MRHIENVTQALIDIKQAKPLIHHITNYVTVNDCANITLAIGASPIMTDEIKEVEEIASIAQAIVLNMGTLNVRTIEAMIKAGQSANRHNVPVLFDPVGAGASAFRNETAKHILEQVKVQVLRGNLSEIRYLGGLESNTKGVDAAQADMDKEDAPEQLAKELAQKLGCTVAITGPVDTISDGSAVLSVNNGHSMLGMISGTGCMCSSLIASFLGAGAPPITAALGGILSMGIAGELAYAETKYRGAGSFHIALRDYISLLTPELFAESAKVNEI